MTIEEKAKRAWEEYCYRADGSLYSTADSVALCTYDGEDMYEVHNDCKCRMPYWMPIPPIPDTNTEKK